MNIYIIAGICILVLTICHMLRQELTKFRIQHYTISMRQESGSATAYERVCRFAFLSDLHNHSYGSGNVRLLEAIDDQKPDFIMTAGDMMTARPGCSMDTAIHLVEELSKKYPVYYGNGNHEYRLRIYPQQYGDMYDQYKKVLDRCGVHHLENAHEVIDINGRKIAVYGLEIDRRFYRRFQKTPMDADYVTEEIGRKPNLYTILIAHNPEYFPAYAKWGADLTLAGHVHGGIVRIPKIGGVLSPRLRLFPKYDGGLYKNNHKYMILSRGLGMHTIPIRIFNRAELIIVDLIDEKNKRSR